MIASFADLESFHFYSRNPLKAFRNKEKKRKNQTVLGFKEDDFDKRLVCFSLTVGGECDVVYREEEGEGE